MVLLWLFFHDDYQWKKPPFLINFLKNMYAIKLGHMIKKEEKKKIYALVRNEYYLPTSYHSSVTMILALS